jgi:imidazole glycerol-phosphate synthase subunit HisH
LSALEIVIVDYGVGNLLSVSRGLENCGAVTKITTDPDLVFSASKIVLPGVGAFASGIAELSRRGLDEAVKEGVARGSTLLGICLGMQMLFDESEEFGLNKGLGLVPGRVVPIPTLLGNNQTQKIPHIGWNDLCMPPGCETWENTLLQEVKIGEPVYFVHSLMGVPVDPKYRLADCVYGDTQVPAVVRNGNVWGCQFHPEKSGEVGLRVLSRFLKL